MEANEIANQYSNPTSSDLLKTAEEVLHLANDLLSVGASAISTSSETHWLRLQSRVRLYCSVERVTGELSALRSWMAANELESGRILLRNLIRFSSGWRKHIALIRSLDDVQKYILEYASVL